MKKGNTPLINGIILAAVVVYLSYYFTVNNMWNPASAIVALIIALLSAGQIVIWFMYFKEPSRSKNKKNKR